MEIKLEKWSLERKEILKDICNKIDRKYLSNRIPNPYTVEDAVWWLNYVNENEGKDGLFRAIVVDGKVCGTISIERKKDIYTKDGLLGYYLLNEYWGKGIMTKVTEEICSLAFESLGIVRISAVTFEENIGSRKVLERNGFRLEGIREKAIFKNEEIHNECVYGKVK